MVDPYELVFEASKPALLKAAERTARSSCKFHGQYGAYWKKHLTWEIEIMARRLWGAFWSQGGSWNEKFGENRFSNEACHWYDMAWEAIHGEAY